ncbi:hypothetical protein [Acinetobacter sp. 1207_04]|uniref:hypothetical protein n=1 Tax=Acinetobacter sp. 1207_04 TaxID=2604449 RepID=UPI00405A3E9E
MADVHIHSTYVFAPPISATLCKALMDPSCQQIYLLGDHTVPEQLLSEFTARTGITMPL